MQISTAPPIGNASWLNPNLLDQTKDMGFRAKTNIRLVCIFALLHKYSNAKRVFGYAVNDISVALTTN